MRRTGEAKHWRFSIFFLETLPERLRGDQANPHNGGEDKPGGKVNS